MLVAQTNSTFQHIGGGTNYLVQTPAGVYYFVYVDSAQDVAFKKSSDGGLTWTQETIVFTGTVSALAVWYDRWSAIAAGLIHCAYTDSATADTTYRTINTESSDALSTQTVIFAGASQATGGHLSITRALGGNVYCKTVIDAGAEGGFFRLPNANVPNGAWDAARTVDEAIATQDAMILMPGSAADNQDILAIFWDNSATEISRKIYDDSANSWAEASISTGFTKPAASTSFPPFAAFRYASGANIYVAAWNGTDTANADLKLWYVTESSITALTDVVLNSTDDQGLVGIGKSIEPAPPFGEDNIFVAYAGKSDGSETFGTTVNVYCKVSRDNGTTWGPENQLTLGVADITWLAVCPIPTLGPPVVAFFRDHAVATGRDLCVSVDRTTPRGMLQVGI